MAQIKITDLNFSDSELMEELTDEELSNINGGSFWRDFNAAFNRVLFGSGVGVSIVISLGSSTSGAQRHML